MKKSSLNLDKIMCDLLSNFGRVTIDVERTDRQTDRHTYILLT